MSFFFNRSGWRGFLSFSFLSVFISFPCVRGERAVEIYKSKERKERGCLCSGRSPVSRTNPGGGTRGGRRKRTSNMKSERVKEGVREVGKRFFSLLLSFTFHAPLSPRSYRPHAHARCIHATRRRCRPLSAARPTWPAPRAPPRPPELALLVARRSSFGQRARLLPSGRPRPSTPTRPRPLSAARLEDSCARLRYGIVFRARKAPEGAAAGAGMGIEKKKTGATEAREEEKGRNSCMLFSFLEPLRPCRRRSAWPFGAPPTTPLAETRRGAPHGMRNGTKRPRKGTAIATTFSMLSSRLLCGGGSKQFDPFERKTRSPPFCLLSFRLCERCCTPRGTKPPRRGPSARPRAPNEGVERARSRARSTGT